MHRERLDFKLEVATLELNRKASCFEGNMIFNYLTIGVPYHTQYILNSMIMDMCRPHPFQVEVARIHNVMHTTTTDRGHQKLISGCIWPFLRRYKFLILKDIRFTGTFHLP